MENFRCIFEMFDKERVGFIDVLDLQTIMRSLGRDPEEANELVANFRTQEPGKMNFEEFLRIMKVLEKKLIENDPFVSLDQRAVGRLMEMAITESKSRKKGIKYGICGEHGGDPRSIRFCHNLGLDYVSCSPFRVPIARIAAAQANVGPDNGDH